MSKSTGLIKSPGEAAVPSGVESDLDSMGRGTATPIEGNEVRLTYSPGEIGASTDFPLSNPKM
jgi:hypothetical protein